MVGEPLRYDERPPDHTPIHTADLPATPVRDRNIVATAWIGRIQATDQTMAAVARRTGHRCRRSLLGVRYRRLHPTVRFPLVSGRLRRRGRPEWNSSRTLPPVERRPP